MLVNCFKYPLHAEESTAFNQLQLENTKVDGSVAAHAFLLWLLMSNPAPAGLNCHEYHRGWHCYLSEWQ